MAYAGLTDGGLSITIGGTERKTEVFGLEWESTSLGDGAASFWMEVADPFNVRGEYPELLHGALVIVTHTYDALPAKTLYRGYIVNDPRIGYAGDRSYVQVECGGALDVAKWRTDCAFTFTDADEAEWYPHKDIPKWAVTKNDDTLYLGVDDGVVVRRFTPLRAAGLCYTPYRGAAYMRGNPSVSGLYGVRRIYARATWDLRDKMRAGLFWADTYSRSRNPLDTGTYTKICDFGGGTPATTYNTSQGKDQVVNVSFAPTSGAGYVVLFLWRNVDTTAQTTDERYIELEGTELYCTGDATEKRVDQAMLAVADFIDLHTGTDTAAVGSANHTLVARPYTDPASACAFFASQASKLVDWGWHQGTFRAKPMETHHTTIRALSNYFKFGDTEMAKGITWDVRQQPEDENPARIVRVVYARKGKSAWPAGHPATAAWPHNPSLVGGTPFRGPTVPVLTVDFSDVRLGEEQARGIARALWRRVCRHAQVGTCRISASTVLDKNSAAYPATYIHGGDWIECTSGTSHSTNPGPLYITRCHVEASTGVVDMDVGIGRDAWVQQLEGIGTGRIYPVKRTWPKRPKHNVAG